MTENKNAIIYTLWSFYSHNHACMQGLNKVSRIYGSWEHDLGLFSQSDLIRELDITHELLYSQQSHENCMHSNKTGVFI